jgi:hypothetical protein
MPLLGLPAGCGTPLRNRATEFHYPHQALPSSTSPPTTSTPTKTHAHSDDACPINPHHPHPTTPHAPPTNTPTHTPTTTNTAPPPNPHDTDANQNTHAPCQRKPCSIHARYPYQQPHTPRQDKSVNKYHTSCAPSPQNTTKRHRNRWLNASPAIATCSPDRAGQKDANARARRPHNGRNKDPCYYSCSHSSRLIPACFSRRFNSPVPISP